MAQESCAIILPQFIAVCVIALTLPVLNDSSKLFCFLHAFIIELCNVSRTIVSVDTKPYYL